MRSIENKSSTIYKSLSYLKEIVTFAIKRGYCKDNPFDDFMLDRGEFHPTRLTLEEFLKLRALYDSKSLKANTQRVLQYFLFACYTGLSWSDLQTLTYNEIISITVDGDIVPVIDSRRTKGDKGFISPIVKPARTLIDLKKGTGKVFDTMTDQATNRMVKRIMEIVGIERRVTFHTARHTFASMAINYGIPEEIVSKMLGHTKSSMTKHYARLDETTVVKTMIQKFKA